MNSSGRIGNTSTEIMGPPDTSLCIFPSTINNFRQRKVSPCPEKKYCRKITTNFSKQTSYN